jgi:hypothetical protein
MPSIIVQDSVEFFYTDSGTPAIAGINGNFLTLVIINGNTFNAGKYHHFPFFFYCAPPC